MTGAPSSTERRYEVFLAALVLLVGVSYLPAAYHANINWDEFRYLSDVYRFEAGTLQNAVHTFHVRLFGWLPALGETEIDQILAARAVYFVLLLVSASAVYLIARFWMSAAAALFAVLCFVAYSDVFVHATAFRFDGLATALLLAGAAWMVRSRSSRSAVMGAAVLSAVAFMVTIKVVFFLPTLALVALVALDGNEKASWRPTSRAFGAAVLFAVTFFAATALLYVFHGSTLASPDVAAATGVVQRAAGRGIVFDDLFPRSNYLIRSLLLNALVWYLVLTGFAVAVRDAWRGGDLRRALLFAAFLAPLASVAVYRNAFPYFYVMLVPLAVIPAGLRFDQFLEAALAGPRLARVGPPLILAGVLITFVFYYPRSLPDEIAIQRDVVEAVHEVFPEPVPYIDRNSMIASFPKVGFFMSTWGFESYRDGDGPIFRDLLLTDQPRFLLANHPALILDPRDTIPEAPGMDRLLPEDEAVLAANFISHWGLLYVAGKRLDPPEGDEAVRFEILIPGDYTIEAGGPVTLSGETWAPGDVVRLDQGDHTLDAAPGEVVLRWGNHLRRPGRPQPSGVLFHDLTRGG